MWAAYNNNAGVTSYLLGRGADREEKDDDGYTAMHWWVSLHNCEMFGIFCLLYMVASLHTTLVCVCVPIPHTHTPHPHPVHITHTHPHHTSHTHPTHPHITHTGVFTARECSVSSSYLNQTWPTLRTTKGEQSSYLPQSKEPWQLVRSSSRWGEMPSMTLTKWYLVR